MSEYQHSAWHRCDLCIHFLRPIIQFSWTFIFFPSVTTVIRPSLVWKTLTPFFTSKSMVDSSAGFFFEQVMAAYSGFVAWIRASIDALNRPWWGTLRKSTSPTEVCCSHSLMRRRSASAVKRCCRRRSCRLLRFRLQQPYAALSRYGRECTV